MSTGSLDQLPAGERPTPQGLPDVPVEPQTVADRDIGQSKDAQDRLKGEVITLQSLLNNDRHEINFEKVEQVKSVIPASILEQLNQLQPGILFDLYVTKSDDQWKVDFAGNDDADRHIGFSQILRGKCKAAIQSPLEGIRALTVYESDGQERRAERKGVAGDFYERKVYQEVHTNYRFRITSYDDAVSQKIVAARTKADEQMRKVSKDFFTGMQTTGIGAAQLQWNTESSTYAFAQEGTMDNMIRYIMFESALHEVDPLLMIALVKTHLTTGTVLDFENKFQWTLRGIKECESHCETQGISIFDQDGHYTEEFLAQLLEFPLALDTGSTQDFFKAYGVVTGKEYKVPEEIRDDHEWQEIEPGTMQKIRDIVPYASGISSHFGFRKRPRTRSGWGSSKHAGLDIAGTIRQPHSSI